MNPEEKLFLENKIKEYLANGEETKAFAIAEELGKMIILEEDPEVEKNDPILFTRLLNSLTPLLVKPPKD